MGNEYIETEDFILLVNFVVLESFSSLCTSTVAGSSCWSLEPSFLLSLGVGRSLWDFLESALYRTTRRTAVVIGQCRPGLGALGEHVAAVEADVVAGTPVILGLTEKVELGRRQAAAGRGWCKSLDGGENTEEKKQQKRRSHGQQGCGK